MRINKISYPSVIIQLSSAVLKELVNQMAVKFVLLFAFDFKKFLSSKRDMKFENIFLNIEFYIFL